jgi:hypothetical protein
LEPYYAGWPRKVAGEKPEAGDDRDNYFARTQAWGSVFSGGLAGHVYGTGAYDGTTVGENPLTTINRRYIWDALNYPAGEQVGYLRKFIEPEGLKFQELNLASDNLFPRKSKNSEKFGLDGWSFMMQTADKQLSMLYFENACEIPEISGLLPNKKYIFDWFDTISGEWLDAAVINSDEEGKIKITSFPNGDKVSGRDWALKIKVQS